MTQTDGPRAPRSTLDASLYCAFGTLGTSIAEFVNASAIRCRTVPAAHAADVALTATHDDGASWSDAVVFTYYVAGRAPSLTALTPPYVDVAATAPGPVVTVRGANFAPTSGLQCGFGDHHVTDATFVSSGEVRCAVPRLSAYSAIVHVRHDGSTWSVGGLHLILHNSSQPARVSAVAPRALPVGARGIVEVSGINFFPAEASAARCVFARPPHRRAPPPPPAPTVRARRRRRRRRSSRSLSSAAPLRLAAVGTAVVAVSFDGASRLRRCRRRRPDVLRSSAPPADLFRRTSVRNPRVDPHHPPRLELCAGVGRRAAPLPVWACGGGDGQLHLRSGRCVQQSARRHAGGRPAGAITGRWA